MPATTNVLRAAGLVVLGLGLPAAAGERAFEAFAPLLALGEQSTVGEDGITRLEGSLTGPLYAQTPAGPREQGMLICDFVLAFSSDTMDETGEAECIFTPEGAADAVTAAFSCVGRLGDGCTGVFEITGGEGALAGASGGGEATLTARDQTFGLGEDNTVRQTIYGLAHWERLVLNLPD